jgi:DamX protein
VEPIAQSATPTTETATTPALPPAAPAPVASSNTQPSVYAPVPSKAVEPAPVTKVIAASTVAPKPSPTVQAKAESKAKPETKVKAVTQTGERFSANDASQYVVQIVTLGSAKAVSTFIKTHGLQDCHSFRQQRDGKELFSLTCGLYPSREAALAAQSQLPSAVSAAKPYPRQIADIRKVMLP